MHLNRLAPLDRHGLQLLASEDGACVASARHVLPIEHRGGEPDKVLPGGADGHDAEPLAVPPLELVGGLVGVQPPEITCVSERRIALVYDKVNRSLRRPPDYQRVEARLLEPGAPVAPGVACADEAGEWRLGGYLHPRARRRIGARQQPRRNEHDVIWPQRVGLRARESVEQPRVQPEAS